MPWRIPSTRRPRCAGEVHRDELHAVPPAWLACDENTATRSQGEQAAILCERRVCPDCHAELRGHYDDVRRCERELRAYCQGGQP